MNMENDFVCLTSDLLTTCAFNSPYMMSFVHFVLRLRYRNDFTPVLTKLCILVGFSVMSIQGSSYFKPLSIQINKKQSNLYQNFALLYTPENLFYRKLKLPCVVYYVSFVMSIFVIMSWCD